MAEAASSSSSILALVNLASESSSKLLDEIQTFHSLPRQVRELRTELSGLTSVLQTLSEKGDIDLGVDLAGLKYTLEQCRKTCDSVEAELLTSCSQSGSDRASFRGWPKLKCGGGHGIEGFRQQLIEYKSIITVALSFANLGCLSSRASAASAEAIQACRDLIATTTVDLEAHLEDTKHKLEVPTTAGANPDDAVRRYMEEERLSTEEALQFCALLSQQTEQIQVDFLNGGLESCSDVDAHLEPQISNIENHAEGNDTIQFMVSTGGRSINGKNHGNGDRLKQAGGRFADATIVKISDDFKSIALHQASSKEQGTKPPAATPNDQTVPAGPKLPFSSRGPGFTLAQYSASPGPAGT